MDRIELLGYLVIIMAGATSTVIVFLVSAAWADLSKKIDEMKGPEQ